MTKYEQGDQITTYGAFEAAARTGAMVYASYWFRRRPVSAKMVENMSYRLVTRMIVSGQLRHAVQTEEYREWLRDELLGAPKTGTALVHSR